jgi:hypothetical protein
MADDDLISFWSSLKPSVLPREASVTEDELYTMVTDYWGTFIIPGARWHRLLPQMNTSGDQIIRGACPEISDEAVTDLLRRFARRYGVPDFLLSTP